MPAHPLDLPLLDNFNRANTGPPAGPIWANLAFWGDSLGFITSSNQMAPSGTGYRCDYTTASYSRSTGPVGLRFLFTVAPTNVHFLWLLRTPASSGAAPTGYALRFEAGETVLYYYNSGSPTDIGSWEQPILVGDELSLIADNDTHVTAWHSTSSTWTKTVDVVNNTDQGPFHIACTTNSNTVRMDNLYGGYASAAAPPSPKRSLLGVGT